MTPEPSRAVQQQLQQAKTEGRAAAASEAQPREFDEIVAPLEKASGKPLGGLGLGLCRAAFRENPHGFRVCAAEAFRRGTRNPLGLLIFMARDGDHRRLAPPSTSFQRAERWVRSAGSQYEPHGFFEELARFPELDDLARRKLGRLYDQLRAGDSPESGG